MNSFFKTSWFWLILVLALALRVPLLNGSFWLDEAAQALESARPFSQQLDISGDFQPPLLHYIVHFGLYLSRAEWWLRVWGALLPGLVSIAGVWWLGKKWFNQATGNLAALLLSTNSFHIFYSQELRPYSLPTMFAVVSWMVVSILLDSTQKNTQKWWFVWAVLSLAGWYSSYIYPFVWVVQWLTLAFILRKQLLSLCGATLITLLGFLPWLPGLMEQLRVGAVVQTSLPGWNSVVGTPWIKSLPLTAAKLIFGVLDLSITLPYIAISAMVLLLLATLVWQQKDILFKKTNLASKAPLFLPLVWLVLPLLLTWLLSLWLPVLQPKRVLFLWPAFSLLFAQLVSPSIMTFLTKRAFTTQIFPGLLLSLILFSINAFSTISYWKIPLLQRENWRELITELESVTPPSNTVAVFAFPAPFAPWEWYASPDFNTISSGTLSINQVSSVRDLIEPINEFEYVVTFEYLKDLSDPNGSVEENVRSYQYSELYLLEYPLIGFTKVWSKQENRLSISGAEVL